jgi:hypothetical protein
MWHALVQLSFNFDSHCLSSHSEGVLNVALDLPIGEIKFTDLGVGWEVEGWQDHILLL